MGVSTASFIELLYFDGGKRYNEYMFENKNKLRGKYICSKPQAELKTDQTVRSIILAAALAVYARKMTFDAYCSSVTLVSAEEAAEAALAEIGPPGAENAEAAPEKKPETRLKTYNPDAEKNLADEVEDFYSDKD